MKVIYQPAGKALEYSLLAVNLYRGCAHGCTYCYAPQILHIPRKKFELPRPRIDIISGLRKDARRMAGDDRRILFCFTSDPYQPCEQVQKLTKQALEIMVECNLKPTILTKSGTWGIKRDLKMLIKAGAVWAATLTCADKNSSSQWEPGAAFPSERIKALKIAKDNGLPTWVSFEPVVNTEHVFKLIEKTYRFVDLYKVGPINYHPLRKQINWAAFKDVFELSMERLGKDYYLKQDLIEAAEEDVTKWK